MTAAASVLRPIDDRAWLDHPSGFLALSAQNERFSAPGLDGFVAFRTRGRHRVVLGGVHAPSWCRDELLDAFLRNSALCGRQVTAVQLRARDVAAFRARGFKVDAWGTSYGLRLGSFTLGGGKRMKLRNRIKRARELDVRVDELGREASGDADAWARLRATSEAWLASKGGHELTFLVGELAPAPERRVFVAHAHGRLIAFITYVPVYGEQPGYLHDLTRRVPDAPAGVMELINATAIERFQQERVPYLHFGFTPFADEPHQPREPADHWLVPRLVRFIRRFGAWLYPARQQQQYKLKWAPDVLDREYLAIRGPSLPALAALMLVTGSLVLPWRRSQTAPEVSS